MELYFEWDEAKNQKNQKKHDVSFETASLVFDDPLRISIQDRHTNGEERWQTIGMVKGVLMLLVAHTIFDEDDCEIIRKHPANTALPSDPISLNLVPT